jgi:hypothetical protein
MQLLLLLLLLLPPPPPPPPQCQKALLQQGFGTPHLVCRLLLLVADNALQVYTRAAAAARRSAYWVPLAPILHPLPPLSLLPFPTLQAQAPTCARLDPHNKPPPPPRTRVRD